MQDRPLKVFLFRDLAQKSVQVALIPYTIGVVWHAGNCAARTDGEHQMTRRD